MKKLFALSLGLLFLFGLASCDAESNNGGSTPSGTDNTDTGPDNTKDGSGSPKTESSNVTHGHGAPNDNEGELYSLYVDDDTNKIYEKNASYKPSSSVQLVSKHLNTQLDTQLDSGNAKWIYTNCLAGENFGKESSIGNAIRSTLLSTNITLKCTLGLSTSSQPTKFDVVTYVAYNYGNVLQKQATSSTVSFDDATLVGYSTYNIDTDSYRLFIQSGQNLVEHTEYIDSTDPMERSIASNFVNRCLNNNMENVCNFALCDTILKELDNFTVTNRVYHLNKTINVTSSALYDALYGAGNYYLEFKNIEFKLNENLNALEYFKFTFGYGKNDRSEWLEEEFLAEISNLRTTYFEIPETQGNA